MNTKTYVIRWTNGQAIKKKSLEMPFHQIPVLEVDGKQLAQCHAICRFLARQFGLAGKSDFDAAMVDAITDQCKDFYIETTPYFRVAFGAIKGDKDDLKKSLFLPSREKLFTYLTKILKNNKSGYFVGDSLTWADLYLACMADHAETVPEFYDGFPEMKAHSDRIRSIPALKEWIETRPKTAF
ncbi:unnamed protein product [Nippostrongylus brasiliensis]|uniref:glutathione transferase n=1 Tax=Nippostrongylus brasiliensis TaxID=27835 RepID=A0A0N4XHB8_NIPBR|nr:unnamed protein product [Nippostrongylus brasiliensis]